MTDWQRPSNITAASDPLALASQSLRDGADHPEALETASHALLAIAQTAREIGHRDASHCARTLAELLDVSRGLPSALGSLPTESQEVLPFVQSSLDTLRGALEGDRDAEDGIQEILGAVRHQWGQWLDLPQAGDEPAHLLDDSQWYTDLERGADGKEDGEEDFGASPAELDVLLAAIDDSKRTEGPSRQEPVPAPPPPSKNAQDVRPENDLLSGPLQTALPSNIEDDLLEAYMDDAGRCLAAIEAAAFALEEEPHDPQPRQRLCRELHTLKGASATVGLEQLAAYLHRFEEQLQTDSRAAQGTCDVEMVLGAVDRIRQQINLIGSASAAASTPESMPAQMPTQAPTETAASTSVQQNRCAPPSVPADSSSTEAGEREESLRVKATQLDRLMDMLAELVMLRNRRDSRVAELQQFSDELIHCATQLRRAAGGVAPGQGVRSSSEIATDVLQIARGQREVGDRIREENLAVSRFIRDFRQELVGLRRLPVSGLFHRLQRAVRDAARAEGKKVQLKLLGEHAGLERSLQERLYEPLLHIVRNAVSHGIESASDRSAAGKDPVGSITLEARGGTSMLVLVIRDDGKGLDYDALRRRGLERGFISADQPISQEELAGLIFRPGFSTKEAATAVSGRGVGMDVVAETLARMRSWVEVSSTPGQGTEIRLSIPLRSVIEHTMIFRCGGQLFGVPMQLVHRASSSPATATDPPSLPTVHFARLFQLGCSRHTESLAWLVVGYGRQAVGTASEPGERRAPVRRFAMLVDKIVGPEEVVVRPLPPLLRHQGRISGITLSGTGELVLLLDSRRLIESHPA